MELHKRRSNWQVAAMLIGKIGFVARGFLWACIGGVAIAAAATLRGQSQSAQGALEVVASTVGGSVLFVVVTIGMFCYSLWRFYEGFFGLRAFPDTNKFMRIMEGYVVPFCSGTVYAIIGVGNMIIVRKGINAAGIADEDAGISRSVSKYVVGQLFLTVAALLLAGVSIGWIVQLVTGRFKKVVNTQALEMRNPRWWSVVVYSTGYLGMTGRAILFALVALLLVRVAWDESTTGGIFGQALQQIISNVFGRISVVLVGILLIFFGIWSSALSVYRSDFIGAWSQLKMEILELFQKDKFHSHSEELLA